MDSLLRKISDRLSNGAEAISTEIEPELKQLILKSISCTAGCYQTPDPLRECEDCASRCNLLVKPPQQELQKRIHHVQSTFQNCMQGCELKNNESDTEAIKTCIFSCSNDADKLLGDIKKEAKDIMRKYLD